MATVIDDETYQLKNVLKCTQSSGDSEKVVSFTVLSGPDGQESWLLDEGSDWWLYRRPSGSSSRYSILATHEEFAAHTVERDGVNEGGKRFAWVALTQPCENAPAPFRGTTEGLVIEAAESKREMMLSIPLLIESPNVFYTPSFPASRLSLSAVEPRAALGSVAKVKHFSLFLAVVFASAALLGVTDPITMLWWLGPVAICLRAFTTQQSAWDHALRLFAGVFFLHFATQIVDRAATMNLSESAIPLFGSAKVAVLCVALWGLRLSKPRIYFAVVDGAIWGGGCSWLVYCCGLLLACFFEEANFFNWFTWYAGALPWSLFWLLGAVTGVWSTLKDYSKAPLDLRGFRSLLFRTAEILEQKLEFSCPKAASLAQWADDLEDALTISDDPLVASLVDYAPVFKALREQAYTLAKIDPNTLDRASKAHLDADLVTMAGDCRALISCLDRWPESREEFTVVRQSPRLRTWGK